MRLITDQRLVLLAAFEESWGHEIVVTHQNGTHLSGRIDAITVVDEEHDHAELLIVTAIGKEAVKWAEIVEIQIL